ncbi:MAG TPA: MBL fold metallo-hydrolase [Rhizobiaceae bacterium]|nr:MBL fold metallo-hydrolase [Rhizobiaceae bacterium]
MGRSRILIDACVGTDKERHARTQWTGLQTPFLDRLAQTGFQPEEIDYVCCTHLHADHVGWNTRLIDGQWVPAFPNAKYIFGRSEYAYWDQIYRTTDPNGRHLAAYTGSMPPVVEAGQMLLADDGFEPDGWLRFEPAPGQVSIWLSSKGRTCVFSGDIVHHPIQLRYPDWSCIGCGDQVQAAVTRIKLFHRIADTDTIMTGHFLAPHAGRLTSTSKAFDISCVECGPSSGSD